MLAPWSFCSLILKAIGPMHEEKILGNTPDSAYCLVLVLYLKVGIPLVKVDILQCFKYR